MATTTVKNALLDKLLELLNLPNDAALANALDLAPPVVSKLRHRTLPLGATHILRIHEASDMPIKEIRELAAA